MAKVLLHRILQMFIVLWMLITLLYFMIHLAPGGPEMQIALDPNLPPAAQEILRQQLGLDQPLIVQYLTYLKNFVTGDLGFSFSLYPREVFDVVMERTPRTLALFLIATLLQFVIGFALGRLIAVRRGGFFEYSNTVVAVLLITVFTPWFALLAIWLVSAELGWTPIRGFIDSSLWRGVDFAPNDVFLPILASIILLVLGFVAVRLLAARLNNFGLQRRIVWLGWAVLTGVFVLYWGTSPMREYALDIAHHMVLPTLVVTAIGYGSYMLLTRTSMLETLREDYVLTARAKGLSPAVVRNRHVARNAMMPVITSLVLSMATLVGGSIVVESVFSWPGLGLTILDGIQQGDTPLVVGAFAYLGILLLVGHFIVDLIYTLLDPRIRI